MSRQWRGRQSEMAVVAAENIPPGATSPHLPLSRITSSGTSLDKISLRMGENGLLISSDDRQLLQCLPLSEDFHSCNAILERGLLEDTVFIQMTRAVKKGERISLWFSTSMQAVIGIPFLTPSNILGEKNYVCHYCGECFEYPNPLKIHLALDCGRLRMMDLWQRLKSPDTTNNNSETSFDLSAMSLKKSPPSPSHSCYSSPSPQPKRDGSLEDRPSSEPPHSAFRPYLKNENGEAILNSRAAEIEAFVSSLGQSKQGHLCLYCGKLYSRKYGLKIHIRTHTGFKPLKCKYCLRPFGDPSNLNKHVRLHAEGDTPYRCELCGKMLVRRRDLDRHMKARHSLQECAQYPINNI